MTLLDVLRILPLLRSFDTNEVRVLLALLQSGLERDAAECAREIALRHARGEAAGRAAKASSDAASAAGKKNR